MNSLGLKCFLNDVKNLNEEAVTRIETTLVWANQKYLSESQAVELKDSFSIFISNKGSRKYSSLKECGRVLELHDLRLPLQLSDYVVTVKGIGATSFAVETDGNFGWVFGLPPQFSELDREKIFHQRFNKKGTGILRFSKAENEANYLSSFDEVENFKTAKALLILKIESLPDADGNLVTLKELESRNLLEKGFNPVILVRAQLSNFRLFDFFSYFVLKEKNVIHEIYRTAKIKTDSKNLTEYFIFLSRTLIFDHYFLSSNGYQTSNYYRWQLLARNLSICGEEMDAEGFSEKKNCFESTNAFFQNFQMNFRSLFIVLFTVFSVLEKTVSEKVDVDAAATVIFDEIEKLIHSRLENEKIIETFYSHSKQIESELARMRDGLTMSVYHFFTEYDDSENLSSLVKVSMLRKIAKRTGGFV